MIEKNIKIIYLINVLIALIGIFGVFPSTTSAVFGVFTCLVIALLSFEKSFYYFLLILPFSGLLLVDGLPNVAFSRIFILILSVRLLFWVDIKFFIKKYHRTWWVKLFLFFFLMQGLLWLMVPSVASVKAFVYLANIFAVTLVSAFVYRRDKDKFWFYLEKSLLIFMLTGLYQLGVFLLSDFYYFWQLWSNKVALWYGGQAIVLSSAYFNTWFDYSIFPPALRVSGFTLDSHVFAILSVFAFCVAIFRNNKVLLALSSSFIILSSTRGVWAAIVPVLAMSLYLGYFYKDKFYKKFTIFCLLILIGTFCLPVFNILLSKVFMRDGDITSNKALSVVDFGEQSNSLRLQIWQSSLKKVTEKPFGYGLGNFAHSRGSVEGVDPDFNLPKRFVTAHNLYLQFLVEIGIVGFIILMIFSAYFFLKKRIYNPKYFYVTIGLLWVLAYSFVDVALLNEKALILFFVLIGILL